MSLWNIGADDVSPEAQQFKDKLASKDGEIAGQQAKLMKQDQEIEDLRVNLNEALQKLARESDRILELQKDLSQCKDDLRNEKNARSNVEASLDATNIKLNAKETETRDLENALDRLSGTSNNHNTRNRKLEQEKSTLENRNRELEASIRHLQSTAAASNRRPPSRSSSSQFHDLRINGLERDLRDLRMKLDGKESEMNRLKEKLDHTQTEFLRVENERLAHETKNKAQLGELQSLLREKTEELEFFRERQEDGGREEGLLQRIDEDEAKIAALEATLRQSGDIKGLKEKLRNMEQHLKTEAEKVITLESQNIDLVQEREDLLTELEVVRDQGHELEKQLKQKHEQIDSMIQERASLMSGTSEEVLLHLPGDNHDDAGAMGGFNYKHVEKLLNSIARLRGERDEQCRRLGFLETEHKFTVEALENCLSAEKQHDIPDQAPITSSTETLTVSLNRKIQHLSKTVATLAILFSHSQSRLEELERPLSRIAERERQNKDRSEVDSEESSRLKEEIGLMTHRLEQSDEQARNLEEQLKAVTTQRDELVLQLEGQKEEFRASQKDLQDCLEGLESRLSEISRTLGSVESERDSLALQVTNLTADLRAVQDELANAEGRYRSLQSQQLTSMTSSEVVQTLREQITELEGRIMRRTEQVGIQQHDIRRLETNLILQEERLSEMTIELETFSTQKEAMLEDCADAREARDQALVQIEALEEEMESLEHSLTGNEEAINALIVVLAQIAAQVKSTTHQSRTHIAHLGDQLNESQAIQNALEVDLASIRSSLTEDIQQLTIAFATSQLRLGKVNLLARDLVNNKDKLAHKLAIVDKHFREQEAINQRLEQECVTLRQGSSTSVTELASRSTEYQVEISNLKDIISEIKAENDLSQQQLAHSSAELQKVQQEKKDLVIELEKTRFDSAQMHEAEMTMQMELATTLNEERANWTLQEKEHSEMLSEARLQIDELEKRVKSLDQEVSQLSAAQVNLQMEKEKALQEADSLRVDLRVLAQEREKLEETQCGIMVNNKQLAEDISQLERERDALVQNALLQVDQRQRELESHKSELESQVANLTRIIEDGTQEIQRLHSELDAANRGLGEMEDKCAVEVQSLASEREAAHLNIAALRQDIEELEDSVKSKDAAMVESEETIERLQEQITVLEAQVQKSISYTNALERQLLDRERALEALKVNLNSTQVELSRAETNAKTAEMNLSLQSAQFKRELAQLQDKLTALQPRRELEDTIASLKERNDEMEELLKTKCAEIEENDDRVLEMMKENKRLSNKVETLTRKAQNLQNKLTAVKATVADSKTTQAAAKSSTDPVFQPPLEPITHSSIQPSAQRPEQSAELQSQSSRRRSSRLSTGAILSAPVEKPVTASVTKPSTSSRVASSATPQTRRPRTPERGLVPPPVFQNYTSEQRRAQEHISEHPASVAGVKRRAPDDFEPRETIPPQGFTADSIPSGENDSTTPRVRRMFGNLQSGFTPIRNKVLLSPKRQSAAVVSTPLIQDVTNSPRGSIPLDSAAKQQRSWLGKIRGTTTSQVAVRSMTRKVPAPRSDRTD